MRWRSSTDGSPLPSATSLIGSVASLIHLSYGKVLELRILRPARLDDRTSGIVRPIQDRPITDLPDLLQRTRRLEALGHPVTVYPDAEKYIQTRLLQQRIAVTVAEIRRDPKQHSLRTTLLKEELLPYQLEGIAFAAGAGRAILADDMGLGKTVQGIGTGIYRGIPQCSSSASRAPIGWGRRTRSRSMCS